MVNGKQAQAKFLAGHSTDAYRLFGCHKCKGGEGWHFRVWAPRAQRVSVVGDFNGWDDRADPCERDDDGVWSATVPAAREGQIYKYAVTGCDGALVLKSDPFALHCETGPATGSRVWPEESYRWSDRAYMLARRNADPDSTPMSIYEVHIGSWQREKSVCYPWYRSVADALAKYCVDMGYTHVELLPLTEYPYDGSWGYQVTGYFAPTSRYGTPRDFLYFVNRLHRSGIGVILDWVPGHFPKDAHGLARFDGEALFERSDARMASHPDWGTLIFNFASPPVQSFLLSSAGLFLERYHIDGLRVDAVSSMLYLNFNRPDYVPNAFGGSTDLGAIAFLQRLTTLCREQGAVSIAEESSAYPGVTAPPERGGLGFTFKWDMGYMHDTLDYFALDPLYRRGSHNKLTFGMLYAFSERFVLAYSHDEVVHGKCSMLVKMFGSYDEKFSSLRALYGFQYGHPGKKLGFMGGEFGQFIEWDYKKELDWFLLRYPRHGEMQRYVRALNHFYTQNPAMYARDHDWEGFQWLNCDDCDRSSVIFLRRGGGQSVVCACNFTPQSWQMRAGLPAMGVLRPVLSSDEYCFGGTGTVLAPETRSEDTPFAQLPCSAMLTLPPLSAVYYEFTEDTQ